MQTAKLPTDEQINKYNTPDRWTNQKTNKQQTNAYTNNHIEQKTVEQQTYIERSKQTEQLNRPTDTDQREQISERTNK